MFIHQLGGNAQLDKNVRQVTRAVSSETHALWHLDRLFRRLCQFGYEVYDTRGLPTLLDVSPRAATLEGLEVSGLRPHRFIAYDEMFKMMTLPSTRRGTATVHNQKGVHLNGFDYWAAALGSPKLDGQAVPVRYDPWELSLAYALVLGAGWVRCRSEVWHLLQGHSEREFRLASEELKKQRSRSGRGTPSAHQVALFLNELRGEELLLLRAREAANREVLALAEGSAPHGPQPVRALPGAERAVEVATTDLDAPEHVVAGDGDVDAEDDGPCSPASVWDAPDPDCLQQLPSF